MADVIDQTGEEVDDDSKSDTSENDQKPTTDEGAVDEGEGGKDTGKKVSGTDEDNIQGDPEDPKFKAALQAQETLQSILENQGYDSVDDLTADLQTGKNLLELFGGDVKAAEAALDSSKTLNQYEAYWAEQEERERREKESPDETIKRIEQEKKELEERVQQQQQTRQEQEKAQKAMADWSKTVNKALASEFGGEIPESHKALVDLVTGLQNPMLDVEMSDKRAVAATTKDLVKAVKAFEDTIIQNYLKSKKDATDTQTGGAAPGGETPAQGEKKIKNLKDARSALFESLGIKR